MKTIVLISGKQGSGKTTITNELMKRWPARDLKFADVIYEMHDACRDILISRGIEMVNEVKDGHLLQFLGTEYGRKTFGEDVWVKIARNTISASESNFIINDCRFENEFDAFPEALRVRLQCESSIRKERAEMWRENTGHASEIDLDAYSGAGLFDLYVDTDNVSGSTSLNGCVELILAQILKRNWIAKRKK